jgi:hypothetical protein
MKARPFAIGCAMAAVFGCAAMAGDTDASLMARWYQSLEAADAEALSVLLSEDAEIILKDLDIGQDKAEFLASMDEWTDAIAGGSISHKLNERADTDMILVTVCYRFKSSEQLNEEEFIIENGMIVSSTQAKVADSCKFF